MRNHHLPSSSPINSVNAFGSLREVLHQRRVGALIGDAKFIGKQPHSNEKMEEARRHVREAMVQHALGRINQQERDRILDILSFAVVAETLPNREPQLESNLDSSAAHGAVT